MPAGSCLFNGNNQPTSQKNPEEQVKTRFVCLSVEILAQLLYRPGLARICRRSSKLRTGQLLDKVSLLASLLLWKHSSKLLLFLSQWPFSSLITHARSKSAPALSLVLVLQEVTPLLVRLALLRTALLFASYLIKQNAEANLTDDYDSPGHHEPSGGPALRRALATLHATVRKIPLGTWSK